MKSKKETNVAAEEVAEEAVNHFQKLGVKIVKSLIDLEKAQVW